MFQIIDPLGIVHDAYGTFIDSDGDIQFIVADGLGGFIKTARTPGYYRLYKED